MRLGKASKLLEGPEAVREKLLSACAKPPDKALAFFGHGHSDRLVAHKSGESDEVPLVDATEGQLRFTWIYALACRSAKALGVALKGSRCEAYVGYDQDLTFPHQDLNARTALADLAIAIPLELHAGRRQEDALREKVRDIAAQIQAAEGGIDQLGFMALNLLAQLQDFVLLT